MYVNPSPTIVNEQANNYQISTEDLMNMFRTRQRRALGMSGWALFTERPKLRGKRKKRADSGLNESGPELKKQRVSGDLGYGDDPDIHVMQTPIDTNEREGMETGAYAGFSEA
ncbi:hypothetical protein DID88_002586 [Monilinia fructigena]|uniref:Uncharacterized protein n=1 Tax=Monilinia fructigena TaxID=38457 RepID=A0A395IP83_9HELO|nr:hypothetical protein DID88_002586 [Monilinia fructigena]